jgi:hypothetical protein
MHVVDVSPPVVLCWGAGRGALRKVLSSKLLTLRTTLQTLIPFLRNLLSRRFSNYSFEVMTLLAGSLERSDAVFTVGRSYSAFSS